MHLEPYSGSGYMAGSSAATSCFQLFGGAAAPPSPSASDQMVSSPAASNLLTPSAASGGNIFQFPPPPQQSIGKEPGVAWEAAMSQQQQQHSPMAISPSFSTLNTPRGSITSTRSHQSHSSHSPMGMMVDGANIVTGGQQGTAEQAYHLGKKTEKILLLN